MANLAAAQLLHLYRADLKLSSVKRNRHEPAVRDSVLVVATAADHLLLCKNRYTALLRSATLTSARVSLAGMHVGITKEQFCRTVHLSPAYEVYNFTDGVENFGQISFAFSHHKLERIEYRELLNLDAID